MKMNLRWRIVRDFVLGLCLVLDGLRLMLTPGVWRVSGLAIRWSGWFMKKWIRHQQKIEAAPIRD